MLYPFIQVITFLVCGFVFSAIPGFIIYVLETLIVSYIFLPKEVKYAFDMMKKGYKVKAQKK